MAFRTNDDDGPCANCNSVSCDTCNIAANLEFAFTQPKPVTVIDLPTEEELEKIMREAGNYYVSCPYEGDRIEPEEYNSADRTARPTERDEYEEMLSWTYESIA